MNYEFRYDRTLYISNLQGYNVEALTFIIAYISLLLMLACSC